jgi:dethiobiotin synthetase
MRGIFVTGTGTGVGKTLTCAALLSRYCHLPSLRYWKPIQTGIEDDDDTATVWRLSGCSAENIFDRGVRLPRPLSPHLSARLAGAVVTVQLLVDESVPLAASGSAIVEGAGGLLVPLNDRELMVDLIHRLALPVLIVARSGLGTINHTLLTVEALRRRLLTVAGVVMVGEPNDDNRLAIEHYGRVSVVGELPRLPSITPAHVQEAGARLDPNGLLEPYLSGTRAQ